MNVLVKDPRSPEMLATLKQNGEVVVEVTVKQLYILHNEPRSLGQVMWDWFVKWRGRFHAYRDSSHVGGADEVVAVRNLTENVDVPLVEPLELTRVDGLEKQPPKYDPPPFPLTERADKEPEWISVVDRLPPERVWVETKIHTPTHVWCLIRRFREGSAWFDVESRWHDYPPTHWHR